MTYLAYKLTDQNQLARGVCRPNVRRTTPRAFISDNARLPVAKRNMPMQAMVNAAKHLSDQLMDIGTKQLVNSLGSMFASSIGSIGPTAEMTAGATTSAAILNAAGVSLAAEMIAGATTAAGILGVAGIKPAVDINEGSVLAGIEMMTAGAATATELEVGGAAAGASIWGPIAALAPIVGHVGPLFAPVEQPAK